MFNFLKKINSKQWIAIVMFVIGAGIMIYSPSLLKSDDFSKIILESILATAGFFIVFFAIIIFIISTWGRKISDILKMRLFGRK